MGDNIAAGENMLWGGGDTFSGKRSAVFRVSLLFSPHKQIVCFKTQCWNIVLIRTSHSHQMREEFVTQVWLKLFECFGRSSPSGELWVWVGFCSQSLTWLGYQINYNHWNYASGHVSLWGLFMDFPFFYWFTYVSSPHQQVRKKQGSLKYDELILYHASPSRGFNQQKQNPWEAARKPHLFSWELGGMGKQWPPTNCLLL